MASRVSEEEMDVEAQHVPLLKLPHFSFAARDDDVEMGLQAEVPNSNTHEERVIKLQQRYQQQLLPQKSGSMSEPVKLTKQMSDPRSCLQDRLVEDSILYPLQGSQHDCAIALIRLTLPVSMTKEATSQANSHSNCS